MYLLTDECTLRFSSASEVSSLFNCGRRLKRSGVHYELPGRKARKSKALTVQRKRLKACTQALNGGDASLADTDVQALPS